MNSTMNPTWMFLGILSFNSSIFLIGTIPYWVRFLWC
jgi:hypothetical protein